MNLQNWLDNLSKHFEYLEKGSGNTCLRKLELFNEMKEDYINNGEKLVNNLRTDCQNLKNVVNVIDAQLLDDQVLKIYFIYNIFIYTLFYISTYLIVVSIKNIIIL